MLRTFVIIGLIVIVASAILGSVIGIAGSIVWFLVQAALLGAVIYFVIRLVSPKTAQRLRDKIEQQSLPRW
jgi:hypothetical protein